MNALEVPHPREKLDKTMPGAAVEAWVGLKAQEERLVTNDPS